MNQEGASETGDDEGESLGEVVIVVGSYVQLTVGDADVVGAAVGDSDGEAEGEKVPL